MYIFAIPGATKSRSSEFLSASDFAGPMYQPPFQKPPLQRIKLHKIVDATIAGGHAVLVDISFGPAGGTRSAGGAAPAADAEFRLARG